VAWLGVDLFVGGAECRSVGSIFDQMVRWYDDMCVEDVLDVAEDAGIPAHAWIAAADGHIGGRGTPLADELRFVLLVCDCVRAAALRNDWKYAMRRRALQRSCFRAWRMCLRVRREAAAEALRRRELATVAGGGGKRKRSKNRGKPGRARSAREGIQQRHEAEDARHRRLNVEAAARAAEKGRLSRVDAAPRLWRLWRLRSVWRTMVEVLALERALGEGSMDHGLLEAAREDAKTIAVEYCWTGDTLLMCNRTARLRAQPKQRHIF